MALNPGTEGDGGERSLIVRAKEGDRSAFSMLIQLNIQRVYRAAFAILRNGDDAEDIAQETFVRAYQSISRFDESRPFFPWLYRIARNLSLNRIQRVTRLDFQKVTESRAGFAGPFWLHEKPERYQARDFHYTNSPHINITQNNLQRAW